MPKILRSHANLSVVKLCLKERESPTYLVAEIENSSEILNCGYECKMITRPIMAY